MLHICLIGIILSMQIDTLNVYNDSANIKDNSISVEQKKIEPNNIQTPDTFFASFNSDTINLEHPLPVSQIIYAEHKESTSVFYSIIFPIIMLVLGVAIERSAQISFDNKKMRKNGERWKSELLTYAQTMDCQIVALEKYVKDYCDNPTAYFTPILPLYHSLDGSMFDNLDKEDLFKFLNKYFKSNKEAHAKQKKIINFTQIVKFLHDQAKEAMVSYERYSRAFTDDFDYVKMEYAGELYAASSHVLKEMPPQVYSELSILFNAAFTGDAEINPFALEKSFIDPSIELLQSYDKQVFRKLNDSLLKMKQSIGRMKAGKANIRTAFVDIIEQYKLSEKMLDEILGYFPK